MDPIVALLFWLVVAVIVGWVAGDAARRGRNWFAWAVLAAATGLIGALVWLVVRRRSPVVLEQLGPGRGLAIRLTAIPLMILSFIVTTFIVTFLFQVARVEGRAMEPTLRDQDRVIVNKFAYRSGEPQVGDIVMLYYPNRPEKTFVKRVVGAENDEVRIIGGRVYRNGVVTTDAFVAPEYRDHNDWGPEVIPEGYYFVMGDRRNNGSDSRHWGFVPKKYIIGRVQYRWWPLGTARAF